jgi:hypothetical protein
MSFRLTHVPDARITGIPIRPIRRGRKGFLPRINAPRPHELHISCARVLRARGPNNTCRPVRRSICPVEALGPGLCQDSVLVDFPAGLIDFR